MAERLLFVDDEPDMEELVRQRFRKQMKEGLYDFEFAQNGRLALDKLRLHPEINMVITDINMPEMDGLTLVAEIGKLNRPIRTVVVSAYGDMQNIHKAMNNGAFDFLTKPIDFQDFETTMVKTLEAINVHIHSIRTEKELGVEKIARLEAQEDALRHAEENARLISEQNVILERKVEERTRQLEEQNRLTMEEKERSEILLLNILPFETAQELKLTGKAVARHFPQVTVMFTDFKGFTMIAEKLSPQELVAEIDECFKMFDEITHKFNVEKIKTIGDAYMAAGGLPVGNDSNPVDVINAALEIQQYMERHKGDQLRKGKPVFEIRIGINTGPVVAGIVGHKKFAYDIWGDTVNLAARMESSCGTGQVNISSSTYELIKDHFRCTYRGEIDAKNKGMVGMYYVDGVN